MYLWSYNACGIHVIYINYISRVYICLQSFHGTLWPFPYSFSLTFSTILFILGTIFHVVETSVLIYTSDSYFLKGPKYADCMTIFIYLLSYIFLIRTFFPLKYLLVTPLGFLIYFFCFTIYFYIVNFKTRFLCIYTFYVSTRTQANNLLVRYLKLILLGRIMWFYRIVLVFKFYTLKI